MREGGCDGGEGVGVPAEEGAQQRGWGRWSAAAMLKKGRTCRGREIRKALSWELRRVFKRGGDRNAVGTMWRKAMQNECRLLICAH